MRCEGAVRDVSEQLRLEQAAVQDTLAVLEKQICSDEAALQLYTAELSAHPSKGLSKVRAFLNEELAQDVPTGTGRGAALIAFKECTQ